MNKKGFTLVELLAVITILGIMALFAVPNVVNMLEKGKKEQNIADAKEMISKAKYKFKMSGVEFTENGANTEYSISDLGYTDYKDGYGDLYDNASNVYIELICVSNICNYEYSIDLFTSKHCLSSDENACGDVLETELNISKVIEK